MPCTGSAAVAISVHVAESAMADIDNYVDILGAAVAWNQIVRTAVR